jgi:hypothetical protein
MTSHTPGPFEPPAHHHHFCHLAARGYLERLRRAGWGLKNNFHAAKIIAGREAVMMIDPAPCFEGGDGGKVRCKVMWLSTARMLRAAYARYCEQARKRTSLDSAQDSGVRLAETGLPGYEGLSLLYDLLDDR